MKNTFIFLLSFLFANHLSAQSIERKLQSTIDSIYQDHPTSVGIMVHVEAPEQGISWSGASGYSDKNLKTKIEPDQPALIASSIKTYVAATILRLVEKQKLTLESPIGTLLTEKTKILFEKDGYNFSAILVKHLLSHTSGIYNYADQEYIDHKNENPKYRWTREKQLELAVEVGDPLGEPGTKFSYADANYLLLTEIIEQLTEQPFFTAMRELLRYKELGINNTWFPTLEEKPKNTKDLVHQYWGEYKWDSYDLDVSWDLYGGGGIACPTKDIALFTHQLFNGNIIKNDSILKLILTEIRTKETELYPYYLGLSQDNHHNMNTFGHGGFWGTVMMHFPTINTTISVYILDRDKRILRRDVLEATAKIMMNDFKQKPQQSEKIKSYLNKLTDFSGTILVAHKNEILEQKAYGLSSIEYNAKNNLDTKFNIASISKLFTAVAALQLYEKGKLDLNKNIGTYLPDYPNALVRDSVTIHQLLTHTSGLQPFYGKGYLQTDKLRYKKVKDYLELFVNDSLVFNPGSNYKYSGSNFVVLGLIIEKITGLDYYDYVTKYIFEKAGMKNTLAIETDSIVFNKASGYTSLWGDRNYLARNDYYLSKASPGGSHYSTVQDLFLFSKALRNNTLLKKETTDLMLQPKVKGFNTHLGYTIDVDQRYNEKIIGHSGGWFGVRTELMDFLASDYTVVVLSNKDDNGVTGASKVIDDLKVMIAGEKR